MKIRKIGHCCLLVQVEGLTILTDPGIFTHGQDSVTGIDVVLITHEHADHLHVDSLKAVLGNNPEALVITNTGVGKALADAGITCTILEGKSAIDVRGVQIEAFDAKHEEIFGEMGQVQNTGKHDTV
jgi:L-ascorbate metabolism protein UlaG (beta-lactamase superfamily)